MLKYKADVDKKKKKESDNSFVVTQLTQTKFNGTFGKNYLFF